MILSEILKNINCTAKLLTGSEEIMHITTSPKDCDKKTLLIIPNSSKVSAEEIEAADPLAVMGDESLSRPSNIPKISAENIRSAVSFAFSNFYSVDYTRLKIIGITGTNGKTSTARLIAHCLNRNGFKAGFIGTGRIEISGECINEENYSMTTPDPPLLYKALKQMELSECTHIVMEVSSHALKLHKVDPIKFEYGVMTGLSPEHMDFHLNTEDYYKAKFSLFPFCKSVIFNIDDKYGRRAFNEYRGRKISAGILYKGNNYATDINDFGFGGIDYLYHGKNFTFKQRLRIAGVYNVYNAMLATAVATDMGIAPCKVKESLSELELIEGRYEIIKDDITVIIDYAHTDSALECILKSIHNAKGDGSLTVVFGAGGERDKEKRPRMAVAAEKYADRIIVTSDNSRGEEPMDIINDIVKGFEKKSYTVSVDRKEAIIEAILNAKRKDTVAIIGKGIERYNIDKYGYHSFDERAIISEALKERHNENKA